jgi:hypothetical protein
MTKKLDAIDEVQSQSENDDEPVLYAQNEEDIDILIEVDIEVDIEVEEIEDIETLDIVEIEDSNDDIVLSKHKIEGKHALKYDTIFKGKKEDVVSEDEIGTTDFYNDSFSVSKNSAFFIESYDNEDYLRLKKVKDQIYNILLSKTDINFNSNRRKPSKDDFNKYFFLLKNELKNENFTNIELFSELSVYFSDNLFNMFKLLDNKWKNLIIDELQRHIGKTTPSKDITNRNIYIGTEIEFVHIDIFNEEKIITGVVINTDYENSIFEVDSFEQYYTVYIKDIINILNNTKFKYNLNKLNNIDFF